MAAGPGGVGLDPDATSRVPDLAGALRVDDLRAAGWEVGIDLGARFQIVDRPDRVPRFRTGRRIAARRPPPLAEIVGAVMNALDFANSHPSPSEQAVRESLEGNLCRCTGYHNIVKSIMAGARAMAK